MSVRLAAVVLCLAVCGCHLVDQRDFDPSAGRKPVPRPGKPGPPPTPSLVTIRYTTPEPQYRDAVASLVERALARKRDVLFMVTTLVPLDGDPQAQADQAAAAVGTGREVAQAIVDDGAESGQVEQAVRVDAFVKVKEVHIDIH